MSDCLESRNPKVASSNLAESMKLRFAVFIVIFFLYDCRLGYSTPTFLVLAPRNSPYARLSTSHLSSMTTAMDSLPSTEQGVSLQHLTHTRVFAMYDFDRYSAPTCATRKILL